MLVLLVSTIYETSIRCVDVGESCGGLLHSVLAETASPQCHVINDVSGAAIFHPDSSTQTFTIPALLAHRLPETIGKKVPVLQVLRLPFKLADGLI